MSYKPVRQFSANEGDWSVDERGPDAIEHDLDVINRMFDPTAEHENGQQGGISEENLNFQFADEEFAAKIGNEILSYLGSSRTVSGQLRAIVNLLEGLENNKQNKLTFDDMPVADSVNPVKSGGVKTAIDDAIGEFENIAYRETDKWLKAHPEATTTVQDGAITEPKFSHELNEKYFNPLDKRLNSELIIHMINGTTASSDRNIYGDCIVISGQVNGIIDFGYDSTATDLINYLTSNDISSLDFCIITHYHNDHIGGKFSTFFPILNEHIDFSNCVFYLPHKNIDWTRGNLSSLQTNEVDVKSTLNYAGISFVEPSDGDTAEFDNNLSIKFHNIGSDYYEDYYNYYLNENDDITEKATYNNFSMLVTLIHNDKHFVFTGDFHYPAQKKNINNINKCDVYKVEHHGLNRTSCRDWLDNINPQYAMIGVYANDYPDETITRQTVSNLVNKGCCVMSTWNGAITLKSNSNGIEKIDGIPFTAKNIFNPSFLYEGQQLIKDYFEEDVKTNGLIDIDKLRIPGIYYTQNSTKMENNVAPILINGNVLSNRAIRLEIYNMTQNIKSIKQVLECAYGYNTNFRIARYAYDNVSNSWSDWYVDFGDQAISHPLDLTGFTAPTIFSSRVQNLSGGFYENGRNVFVYCSFQSTADYSFGSGAYTVLTGFPAPIFDNAVLNVFTSGSDANTAVVLRAQVYANGQMRLVTSGALPRPDLTSTFFIQGQYTKA